MIPNVGSVSLCKLQCVCEIPSQVVVTTSCILTGRRIPLCCPYPFGVASRGRASSSFPWSPSRWWRSLAYTDRPAQGKQEDEEGPFHSNRSVGGQNKGKEAKSMSYSHIQHPVFGFATLFYREARTLMELIVLGPFWYWAIVWVILAY